MRCSVPRRLHRFSPCASSRVGQLLKSIRIRWSEARSCPLLPKIYRLPSVLFVRCWADRLLVSGTQALAAMLSNSIDWLMVKDV
jgi:hypothetical protein